METAQPDRLGLVCAHTRVHLVLHLLSIVQDQLYPFHTLTCLEIAETNH